MRVLIVGGGAREHALAWRLSQDPGVEIIGAPGNAGIAAIGRTVAVDPTDAGQVVALAKKEFADLVVVGPEAPLVAVVTHCRQGRSVRARPKRLPGPVILRFGPHHATHRSVMIPAATRYIENAHW
jgi:phosphoribosylamine-glycine ligase